MDRMWADILMKKMSLSDKLEKVLLENVMDLLENDKNKVKADKTVLFSQHFFISFIHNLPILQTWHWKPLCLPKAILHEWLKSVEVGEIQDAHHLQA